VSTGGHVSTLSWHHAASLHHQSRARSPKANPWADPGCGPLLTLLQFATIAAVSLPHVLAVPATANSAAAPSSRRGACCGGLFKRPVVSLWEYGVMTALFASMSVLNNAAFAWHISQPMHMVFRSANMIVTAALGWAFFGRRYSTAQLLSVAAMTAGVLSATLAEVTSGDTAKKAAAAAATATVAHGGCGGGGPGGCGGLAGAAHGGGADAAAGMALAPSPPGWDDGAWHLVEWGVGVAILAAVLVLQTLLGQFQNLVAARRGRAPQESMFYQHALAIPLFAAHAPALAARAATWSASPPLGEVVTHVAGVACSWGPLASIPVMWVYAALNVASQYACIVGVYNLTPIADPLTINVVLTVRKFASLLLSIIAFRNTFTLAHWAGMVAITAGVLVYLQSPTPAPTPTPSTSKPAHTPARLTVLPRPGDPPSAAVGGSAEIAADVGGEDGSGGSDAATSAPGDAARRSSSRAAVDGGAAPSAARNGTKRRRSQSGRQSGST